MKTETVFIGFGSNVEDRLDYCERAVALMKLLPHSRYTGVSSYYETEPIDPEGCLGAIWFYNGVVQIETTLAPQRLALICRETERALGRDEHNRRGPRTIDLDILFYGQHVIHESALSIPHPRLHLRRFVLEPMMELAPTWRHPELNLTMSDLCARVDDRALVRRLARVPGAHGASRPSCRPFLSS